MIFDNRPRLTDIRIENTNACGYRCVFCPREKMTRKTGIMSEEMLRLVLARIMEYQPDFEEDLWLHNYGEPLLDPGLPRKASMAARTFPQSTVGIITTMGVPVSQSYLRNLLESGLTRIIISLYSLDPMQYRSITRSDMFDVAVANTMKVVALAAHNPGVEVSLRMDLKGIEKTGNAPGISTSHSAAGALRKLISEGLIAIDSGLSIHNFGGGRSFNPPGQGRCKRIMEQNILQVLWNMAMVSCCFDFDAMNIMGDLESQSLEQIYNSDRYQEFYQAHLRGEANKFAICRDCDINNIP